MKNFAIYRYLRSVSLSLSFIVIIYAFYRYFNGENHPLLIGAGGAIALFLCWIYIPGRIYTIPQFEKASGELIENWKTHVQACWKFKSGYLHEINTGYTTKTYIVFSEKKISK